MTCPGGAPRGGVEAGGRLVEEDQLGVADQRERDVQPAALAAGERGRPLAGAVGQAHERERLVHRPRGAVVARVQLEALADGQAGIGQDSCSTIPIRSRHDCGACAGSVPSTLTLPALGSAEALEDLDGRGLAGAVGAEEGEDLAAADLEVDARAPPALSP